MDLHMVLFIHTLRGSADTDTIHMCRLVNRVAVWSFSRVVSITNCCAVFFWLAFKHNNLWLQPDLLDRILMSHWHFKQHTHTDTSSYIVFTGLFSTRVKSSVRHRGEGLSYLGFFVGQHEIKMSKHFWWSSGFIYKGCFITNISTI